MRIGILVLGSALAFAGRVAAQTDVAAGWTASAVAGAVRPNDALEVRGGGHGRLALARRTGGRARFGVELGYTSFRNFRDGGGSRFEPPIEIVMDERQYLWHLGGTGQWTLRVFGVSPDLTLGVGAYRLRGSTGVLGATNSPDNPFPQLLRTPISRVGPGVSAGLELPVVRFGAWRLLADGRMHIAAVGDRDARGTYGTRTYFNLGVGVRYR